MPSQYNITGYESLSITSAEAVKLTRVGAAKSFVGRLETASVRFRGDDTAPTTSEGVLLRANDLIVLNDSEIDRAQFIAEGTTATLRGHYYSTEAGMFT